MKLSYKTISTKENIRIEQDRFLRENGKEANSINLTLEEYNSLYKEVMDELADARKMPMVIKSYCGMQMYIEGVKANKFVMGTEY